jgi:hypothetical protein
MNRIHRIKITIKKLLGTNEEYLQQLSFPGKLFRQPDNIQHYQSALCGVTPTPDPGPALRWLRKNALRVV